MQEKLEATRVIIDTNLWISFLIGKQLANLKELIVDGTIEIVVCEQFIEEILLVTQRQKLSKYFSREKQKLEELIGFLRITGNVISWDLSNTIAIWL